MITAKHAYHIFLAACGLLLGSYVVWGVYGELRTWPTSEEIAADQQRRTVQDQQAQQQRAVQAQRDAESAARINSLCEEQQMCVRYGNAAKHCAVAANFDSCMKVMMPGEDVVARYACRSDGSKHPPRICRAASRACCTGTSSREINDHTGPRWFRARD